MEFPEMEQTVLVEEAAASLTGLEAEEGMASQPSPSLSPPQVAKPVLASTLLDNILRQRHQFEMIREKKRVDGVSGAGPGGKEGGATSSSVTSGFKELDDYVLMGGMERGAVVGISGDGENGGLGRLISLHILASTLLSNPLAKASIIDTTGSFPVPMLAEIVRLRATSQVAQTRGASEKDGIGHLVDKIVQDILGQVEISRAFDIEGVWEVLSEISANCRSDTSAWEPSYPGEEEIEGSEYSPHPTSLEAMPDRPEVDGREGRRELEIGDSEGEDEEIILEDEPEEADRSHNREMYQGQDDVNVTSPQGLSEPPKGPTIAFMPLESNGRTEIVIIDNMTTAINELFSRREKSFAHTLLTAFSRTLHTLSQTHNILPILLNTLTYISNQKQPSQSRAHAKSASIFAATIARPAFGRLFSDLCALHLFISVVPKTVKDAQAAYTSPPIESSLSGDDADEETFPPLQPQRVQIEIQYAYIIEVLKDTVHNLDSYDLEDPRHHNSDIQRQPFQTHAPTRQQQGSNFSTSKWPKRKRTRKASRCQRWAPFIISADGLELQNAFGHRAEPSAPVHVMHLVKQFPFGRRA